MPSMLSQIGSFPLEEHGCRVPSLMSQTGAFPLEEQMGSFPLEEPERVPSSWSPSMRSDLEHYKKDTSMTFWAERIFFLSYL